ncbi:ELL-associated factor 2-like [Iris pallida]|uniref:ELL-associated factor 2-like n=1 Tax=Iris pallida TaxID=29817 RepID=A0AAX6DVR7_IRIPA|nr:ELL-associated factor 2-like [Iris pallida]
MANNNGEPSTGPQPERWYELRLGSSFKDQSSSKFCTLRYDFKPASIDKSQVGSLHKTKENRVTVEFNNNQPGKPKVTFDGSSEECRDNDGVLFFDGETFRLERLHRSVKRLKLRQPGDSAASTAVGTMITATPASVTIEARSPPLGKIAKIPAVSKTIAPPVALEVERIDIGERDSPVPKPTNRSIDCNSAPQNTFSLSPDPKDAESDENIDILVDDDDDPVGGQVAPSIGFDINLPSQIESDDEIANVDASDDEAGRGPSAAEALRAQVNAEEGQQQKDDDEESSSSSGSSGSSSASGSESSSSSSSDDDSAGSGGDIDI